MSSVQRTEHSASDAAARIRASYEEVFMAGMDPQSLAVQAERGRHREHGSKRDAEKALCLPDSKRDGELLQRDGEELLDDLVAYDPVSTRDRLTDQPIGDLVFGSAFPSRSVNEDIRVQKNSYRSFISSRANLRPARTPDRSRSFMRGRCSRSPLAREVYSASHSRKA